MEKLIAAIAKNLSISSPIIIHYFEPEFQREFVLNHPNDLPDKAEMKVILPQVPPPLPNAQAPSSASHVSNPSTNDFMDRLQDIQLNATNNPIFGINDTPDCTLKQAVSEAQQRDPDLQKIDLSGSLFLAEMVAKQKVVSPSNPYHLTVDELAVIHLYTQESPFYKVLNERLRSEKRQMLVPFFRSIKLLLRGLYKLPAIKATVYREFR